MDFSGGGFPGSSMESRRPSLNWPYGVFANSLLGPDPNILGGLGLHPLQELGLTSWEEDHGPCQSFEASSSHSQTPSLTISPFTSSMSDFSSLADEPAKFSSPNMPSKDDQKIPCAEKSNAKRKHTPKTKSSGIECHLKKGFDSGKTSATHTVVCGECGMRFRQRGELRKHAKVKHTSMGQRPHACSQCDMRFFWPKDVKRHEERVHKRAATRKERHSLSGSMDRTIVGDGPLEDVPDMEILGFPDTDFQLFLDDDDYDSSLDPTTQQDWLCEINNPDQNTFPRTHFPGEGSAPHRGARV